MKNLLHTLVLKSLLLCLALYQRLVSPVLLSLGVRCRFEPSCSAYSKQAILVHGVRKGFVLTVKRLLRCHPLCEGGNDPVPSACETSRKNW